MATVNRLTTLSSLTKPVSLRTCLAWHRATSLLNHSSVTTCSYTTRLIGSGYRQVRYLTVSRIEYQLQETTTLAKNNWLTEQSVSPEPHVDERLSYAYGRSLKELKYCTLAPIIDERTKKEPHSTAVIVYDEGISKSFEDLQADINRLANGMALNLGLKGGDKVALYSYNSYQFVLVQLACHKLGLVFNPINPSYKSHEFSFVMTKTDAKVLFTPGRLSRQAELNNHYSIVFEDCVKRLKSEGNLANLTDIVVLDGDFDPNQVSNVNVRRWRDTLVDSAELKPEVARLANDVRSDDIYGVYYTSGTTGFPKGAAISQFNAINNAALTCERLFNQRGPNYPPMRPNVCLPLPLFHEFAGLLGILLPFTFGGSILLPGLKYSIKSVVDAIMRFKCNVIFLTPTILIDLIGHVESNQLATKLPIQSLLIAGSPVMPELVAKAHKALPNLEEFRIGYGSSENGVIATVQTSMEPEHSKPYTVGPPLDFTEIRIADAATGATTPLGEPGEIQTRGFNTMVGYYNDPEKTAEVITQSRWYKTGDLGTIDQDGRLKISGRIKDLIIKGGENIYPREVESVLHKVDLIEDAHVFGVPDKRFGEEVCTWIKLNKSRCGALSEEELRSVIIKHCKDTLTYFKVPKYVIFIEEFPMTPVKKIKKFEMRSQTIEKLKLE